MKKISIVDVLVIYSNDKAFSALENLADISKPFGNSTAHENYNQAYEHFLESCTKRGLTAALSTTADVIGPGLCKSYWVYANKRWHKAHTPCYSKNIFDKFAPKNRTLKTARKLCFSSSEVQPFTSDQLKKLFSDKLLTATKLNQYSIPTVPLNTDSEKNIFDSIQNLREMVSNHPHAEDFSSTIIMKDRYGAEGNAIYKISGRSLNKIHAVLTENPSVSFILQPFVKFDTGYSYNNCAAATDIRLIFQNGKVAQTYIRMAKQGDFRCNQHQGGTLYYTTLSDIPQKVMTAAATIVEQLKHTDSLFALDFIVSNSGSVYFLEGNSGPGIIWELGYKKDEQMAKQLIKGIITEFAFRIDSVKRTIKDTQLPAFSPQAQVLHSNL